MSVYISAKTNQLVDEDFYGKKIKYKLWEPEHGVKGEKFAKEVLSAHRVVIRSIPFEDRGSSSGKEVREMVLAYMGMTPSNKKEVELHGFISKPKAKAEDSLLMKDLLIRYMKEDKKRSSIKTVFLNDGYINMWLIFLEKHYPNLTFAQFRKGVVEEFKAWRVDFRLANDQHSGKTCASTINKELDEAHRCVTWLLNNRIVSEDYKAFEDIRFGKYEGRSIQRVPLHHEEQIKMLECIRPTNCLMNNTRSVAIVCASTTSMRHRHDKRLISRTFICHTHQWPATQTVLQGTRCPLFDVPVLAT